MRQIKELFKENKDVWVYLSTDETKELFIKEIIREGFTWRNGEPVTKNAGGYLFGIHSNMTIAHLSNFIWCMSFQGVRYLDGTLPLRVDFEKFTRGDDDYICREPHISGYMTM